MVKVYIDGGASPNPGPAAAAYVNPERGDKDTMFIGEQTNNFAEYTALKMVLEKYRWEPVLEILTDSQLVKEQMAGNFKVASFNIAPIYLECKQIVGGRKQMGLRTIITKIQRKNNQADRLVRNILELHATESSAEL